ncbi:microtubule-associated protein RP/EB family member 1 isoform X2 [Drosophila mojavensis]|uniref:microtubule-associated protein RP/EB family member 1 isoform X2 n=1 Tax=Drosophila mojavensis TaxID=7230 RepID=UPI0013EE7C62|nr:microtubule-associated protein RP/EB family member 1 isoform X2 [Drosophila mojavensis]
MKMFLLTMLACLAAAVCAGPSQSLGESKLLQAMRSTNALQQNNPARSIKCFQYYSEVFDQLLQQYEEQYQTCENASETQLATLDWLYESKLSGLSNNAQSACQLIQNCDNLTDTASALACYAQVGTEDAKVMYNISGSASQYNGEFNQKKQVIEYQLEECSNEARRAYEVDTEQTYVRLQACLMGTEPVPSTTTAGTSASPVTTTTTPVPSTAGSSTADTSSSTVIRTTTTPVPSTTARSTKVPKTTTTTTTTDIPVTTTTTEDPFQV